MNIREAFVIASRSLRANKLRSVLTTLGIIIGVAAVIVLVGLGDGVKAGFNSSFGAMANQLVVSKVTDSVLGGEARNLSDADVRALRNPAQAPDLASVTPEVTGSALATYGQRKLQAAVTGSTTDYPRANNRELVAGRMFDAAEERGNARVALLGPNAVVALFGGDAGAALGKDVRLGRANFTVVGVLDNDGMGGNTALVPLGAARAYLVGGGDRVNQIIVKAAAADRVPAAEDEVTRILDGRHFIKDPTKRDFEVHTFQNQLNRMRETLTFLTLFTVAVAGISLIVGGIGVANIMLVSVTERTREIGIRKAIGARRGAIMKQFLIESTVLAGLGGLAGALVGVGITLAAANVIPRIAPNFGTPTVSLPALAVSFLFSLAIGLFAGGYPALRAARLRPIEALRFQ